MRHVRLFLSLSLVLAAVLLPGSARAVSPALTGTVGPGFSIRLVDASGTRVSRVSPGLYSITVKDLSAEHSFHLTGPGVDKATDIAGTGTVTWDVALVNGTYSYRCDAHPTIMHGSFTVGPPLPKLGGRVGPGRTISLKNASGTLVTTLPAGTYSLTVRDSTKADNFHLLGAGVSKRTGVAFRGTAAWTVSFQGGKTYVYRSDAHPKLRRTFKVLAKVPPPPPPVPS